MVGLSKEPRLSGVTKWIATSNFVLTASDTRAGMELNQKKYD